MVQLRWNGRLDLVRTGPKITVQIDHPSIDRKLAKERNLTLPPPLTITALVDTGSSRTVINPQVAASCGLRITGTSPIATVGGTSERPVAPASIGFPGIDLHKVDFVAVVI